MSDDEVDEELLELLRQSLLSGANPKTNQSSNPVLRDAEFIADNAIDVAIDSAGVKSAAKTIYALMLENKISPASWSEHRLHPKDKTEATVYFIFTLDLLNFSFWPDVKSEAFTVAYDGVTWTGYWALVAALRRAVDEEKTSNLLCKGIRLIHLAGIPITSPDFWRDESEFTSETMRSVFRSESRCDIPLLEERRDCLVRAGKVLHEELKCSFIDLINDAKHCALALVDNIVKYFPQFRDEAVFDGRPVKLYKRVQILVADLWACFEGKTYGEFHDIDKITMFADYRIPQILHTLNCIRYSPSLEHRIKRLGQIEPGETWEVQIRGCSIWCIELIRRQILQTNPGAVVNAILIDFFLYDTVKERECQGIEMIPHHRTRSIWY